MKKSVHDIWIVSTVFAPAAQVMHWMEVNALNCGVTSFRLYLESHGEKERLETRCEELFPHWKVTLVAATDEHYKGLPQADRAHIDPRQCYNLKNASEALGEKDWILHIDVDEVIATRDAGATGSNLLDWVRERGFVELDELRFALAEYAAEHPPTFGPGEFPAGGMFKIRPYRTRAVQHVVRLLFPRSHPLIGSWHFRGHVLSKAAFRTDSRFRLEVHGPAVHRGTEEEQRLHERHKTQDWMLLHFDAMHAVQIRAKFEFIREDLAKGGHRLGQRSEIIHLFLGCKSDDERDVVFNRYFSIKPRVRRFFVLLGLMKRVELEIPLVPHWPESQSD